MAAPTTAVLDTFTRADESPAVGWTADVSGASYVNLKVVSNQALPISAFCSAYWNAGSFTGDQEVYATVPTIGAPIYSSLLARIQNAGATVSYYELRWDAGNSYLFKVVSGAASVQIGGNLGVAIAAGDKLWLTVIGTTLTAYRFTGGVWVQIGQQTDGSISGAGSIGVWIQNSTTAAFDDFGGGSLTTSVSPLQETIHVTLARYPQRPRGARTFRFAPALVTTPTVLPVYDVFNRRTIKRHLARPFAIRRTVYKLIAPIVLGAGNPPVVLTPPIISGFPVVGQTLSSTSGVWDVGVITYQWQQDTAGNGVFSSIVGATNPTLLLDMSNDCNYIRCIVTSTSIRSGSTSYITNVLGPVRGLLLATDVSSSLSVTPKIGGSTTLPVDLPTVVPLITDEEC